MTWWQMYLFTRLDALSTFGQVTGVLFGVLTIFWLVFYGASVPTCEGDEDSKQIRKQLNSTRWIYKIAILSILLGVLTPSKSDIAMIYIVPKIANSEIAQELPEDLKMLKTEEKKDEVSL